MHLQLRMDSGATIDMDQVGAEPMTYEALEDAIKVGGDQTFEATLYGANTSLDGENQHGNARVKTKITFEQSACVYALVEGGWLPAPFVAPPNLLVDRNVVSILKTIREGAMRGGHDASSFWLRFLDSPEVLFNPLLCAFEGSRRRVPRYREFEQEFAAANAEIRASFPAARVVDLDRGALGAAYQLVLEVQDRANREILFLTEVAPRLAGRIRDRELAAADATLHELRIRHGLPVTSLVFMAALSCLYEDPQGCSPTARRLLKPRLGYESGDAYNALADLRHLEILVQVLSHPEIGRFAVCTRDQALALFWTGIAPRGFEVEGNFSTFTFTFEPRMFPRLSRAGIERLKGMAAD